jgi:hypothetical protein
VKFSNGETSKNHTPLSARLSVKTLTRCTGRPRPRGELRPMS